MTAHAATPPGAPSGLAVAERLPDIVAVAPVRTDIRGLVRRRPAETLAIGLLAAMAVVAVAAPWLGTVDPGALATGKRLQAPAAEAWFGRDVFGRDVYSRVVYGAQVSLVVGASVATLSTVIGLAFGLCSGMIRWLDGPLMRMADAMMAVPPILLAIALGTLTGGGASNVVIAITLAETPRVARLARGLVASLRDRPFIDAAVASGATTPSIAVRHILPNAMGPLVVQATYICAAAMIIEAILSFLGAGVPPETPSWGNIISEGRAHWRVHPNLIVFPAIFLSLTALSVNLLGDALRDALDPHAAKGL